MSEEEKTEVEEEKPEGESKKKKKATPKAPAQPKRRFNWSGNAGNTPRSR